MNYIYRLLVLTFIMLFSSLSVQAEEQACDHAILKTLGEHLAVKNFRKVKGGDQERDGVIVSLDCKKAPWNKQLTLVATAYRFYETPESTQYKEDEKQIVLAIVNGKNKTVDAMYSDIGYEDAATQYDSYSLKIDTARYYLSKGIRAFGFRLNNAARMPGAADRWDEDELTLFVEKEKQLIPVITSLSTIAHRLTRFDDGAPAYDTASISLTMSNKSFNGYRNLRLKAEIVTSTHVRAAYTHYREEVRKLEFTELIFNGERYVVKDKKRQPWWVRLYPEWR